MTITQTALLTRYEVEIPPHLIADAEIPVSTSLHRQGDVLVRPMRAGKVAGLQPIPSEGVAVVRGEAGRNTHLLVGSGQWAAKSDAMTYGTLLVGEDDTAYLLHPEHGATGIGAGCYILSGQREQADEIRRVAD